jgi:hypothetical protein
MPPSRYCTFLTSGKDGIEMAHTDDILSPGLDISCEVFTATFADA